MVRKCWVQTVGVVLRAEGHGETKGSGAMVAGGGAGGGDDGTKGARS